MTQTIALTVETLSRAAMRTQWQAYGQSFFGSPLNMQRCIGLTILALVLVKVLTSHAYACSI